MRHLNRHYIETTYLLSGPEIPSKVITEYQILVVRIAKEVGLGYWPVLVVEELESVLI